VRIYQLLLALPISWIALGCSTQPERPRGPEPVAAARTPRPGSRLDPVRLGEVFGMRVRSQDCAPADERPDCEVVGGPELHDVEAFEYGLMSYLRQEQERLGPEIVEFHLRYARQYRLSQNGRYMLVDFLCRYPSQWDDAVSYLDGGDCYFSLRYDIVSRAYMIASLNRSPMLPSSIGLWGPGDY